MSDPGYDVDWESEATVADREHFLRGLIDDPLLKMASSLSREYDKAVIEWLGAKDVDEAIVILGQLESWGFTLCSEVKPIVSEPGDTTLRIGFTSRLYIAQKKGEDGAA